MLGMIFTELLELVEKKYGYEVVDKLMENDQLPSGGIYTAVGSYDHSESFIIISQLSELVDAPVTVLVSEFGQAFLVNLIESHPQILTNISDSFDLLSKIDRYIHLEVGKLYPNAQLPHFTFKQLSENHIQLHYRSARPLATFAAGFLLGCAYYFYELNRITRMAGVNTSERNVTFDMVREPNEGTHG